VHNVIDAVFEFKDGKIIKHTDSFDLWTWESQALGLSGAVFGWLPPMKHAVRAKASKRLQNYMTNQASGNAEPTKTQEEQKDTKETSN